MATLKEKREKLQERIAKLQAREKALAQKDKVKERKERTKRLIELGAIVESKFSDDAVFVLKYLSAEKLANVEKWLLEHKEQANLAYVKMQNEKAEAKNRKEQKPQEGQETSSRQESTAPPMAQ